MKLVSVLTYMQEHPLQAPWNHSQGFG